jgi:hypothetical protein
VAAANVHACCFLVELNANLDKHDLPQEHLRRLGICSGVHLCRFLCHSHRLAFRRKTAGAGLCGLLYFTPLANVLVAVSLNFRSWVLLGVSADLKINHRDLQVDNRGPLYR